MIKKRFLNAKVNLAYNNTNLCQMSKVNKDYEYISFAGNSDKIILR